MQDQLEDLTEQSNEIQEIMGRSYGMPEIDDDELDAELEALGDEIALDDDTAYLDEASKAPNAPTAVPGADSITNKVNTSSFFISSAKLVRSADQNVLMMNGSASQMINLRLLLYNFL